MAKYPLILTSSLTNPPRYYVTSAWKVRELEKGATHAQVEVTGKKYDVTEQIEAIVAQRIEENARLTRGYRNHLSTFTGEKHDNENK